LRAIGIFHCPFPHRLRGTTAEGRRLCGPVYPIVPFAYGVQGGHALSVHCSDSVVSPGVLNIAASATPPITAVPIAAPTPHPRGPAHAPATQPTAGFNPSGSVKVRGLAFA
jgi:hypothetical protein